MLITAGLGGNQTIHFSRLDSTAKGYRKGQPDLELKCQDGDRTGIITIDFKHPSGSNSLFIHQEEYIELLHNVNVTTFTRNVYADIIGL